MSTSKHSNSCSVDQSNKPVAKNAHKHTRMYEKIAAMLPIFPKQNLVTYFDRHAVNASAKSKEQQHVAIR